MKLWKLRVGGLFLLIAGGYLFVYAIRDVSNEWPQIFLGLLSVFVISMGFGLIIMPTEDLSVSASQTDSNLPENKN